MPAQMPHARMMTLKRALLCTIVGVGAMASGIGAGSPASAAATGSIAATNGAATITYTANGDPVTVFICPAGTVTCAAGSATYNIATVGLVVMSASPATIAEGTSVFSVATIGAAPLPAGSYVFALSGGGGGNPSYPIGGDVPVTIAAGGGASTGTTANTPVPVSLDLDLAASGASCKAGSASPAVMGAWMTLPAASDCTSTTRPNARLLGWSTNADFPVDVAQSQVDKKWGAIDEVFDGVRMIFIPAGQATFVSGPNSLHPIWAN